MIKTKKWNAYSIFSVIVISIMSFSMIIDVTQYAIGKWDGNTADLFISLGKGACFIVFVWKVLPFIFRKIDEIG